MMRRSTAEKLGLTPLAIVVGHSTHAQEPGWFTTAPVGAIKKLYAKTGWNAGMVDLFEINEAFAVVTMAAMKEHGLPHEKVNIHGGACALGHPIGASGARILVTLIGALRKTERQARHRQPVHRRRRSDRHGDRAVLERYRTPARRAPSPRRRGLHAAYVRANCRRGIHAMILTQEHQMLRDSVRQYAREQTRAQRRRLGSRRTFPAARRSRDWPRWACSASPSPEEWGGAGMDYMALALAMEEIAAGDGAHLHHRPGDQSRRRHTRPATATQRRRSATSSRWRAATCWAPSP